jgi:tetratricopeptide (TPR) repeat protein
MRLSPTVTVLALCLSSGCKSSPSEPKPSASAASTGASAASKLDQAKALALAPVPGTATLDTLLLQRQNAARRTERVDGWILLGQAWVKKARQSADPGFYLNADACADVALDLVPDSKLALDLRGLVLLNGHKFEEARKLAQQVVDQNPGDPMGYGNLSDALLELGRFDDAARAAQKMVDLKPNLPSYSRAYYLRWLSGDVEEAIRIARLAIDSGNDPTDPEPRAWMLTQSAMLFWHKGDYDGADAGFSLALQGASDFAPALVGRGRVLLAKGDAKRAADLLSRALRESPLSETAWLLGDAQTLAGDDAAAKAAYARVEKEGQADPRTLSLFYATKSLKPERALALAEAEKKVRGDVYTEDALAWALYRNGKLDAAKAAIDRALAHGTKDARLLYHSGAIRVASGDAVEGRRLVKAALALNPKFDVTGAAEAERLVAGEDAGSP